MSRSNDMPNGNGVKIKYTARFLKSVKKLERGIREKLERQDGLFRQNPFDPRLNTHKLHGRWKEYWAYSVDYHYRVIFIFEDAKTVMYYDIGPHPIYRKGE